METKTSPLANATEDILSDLLDNVLEDPLEPDYSEATLFNEEKNILDEAKSLLKEKKPKEARKLLYPILERILEQGQDPPQELEEIYELLRKNP